MPPLLGRKLWVLRWDQRAHWTHIVNWGICCRTGNSLDVAQAAETRPERDVPLPEAAMLSESIVPAPTMLQALATCTDFRCIREAHTLPRAGARFNFPHAL